MVFFERVLEIRISPGHHRPGFPVMEAQVVQQSLGLPDPQFLAQSDLDETRKALAIPEVAIQPGVLWCFPEGVIYRGQIIISQYLWSTWTVQIVDPLQTFLLEPIDPGLDRPDRVAQEVSDLLTVVAFRHEQKGMQTMVVPGIFVALDLILQCHDDRGGVGDLESLHPFSPNRIFISNYLCR